jgi:hypothetical protein
MYVSTSHTVLGAALSRTIHCSILCVHIATRDVGCILWRHIMVLGSHYRVLLGLTQKAVPSYWQNTQYS